MNLACSIIWLWLKDNIYLPVRYSYLSISNDNNAGIFCYFSVNVESKFFVSDHIINYRDYLLYFFLKIASKT